MIIEDKFNLKGKIALVTGASKGIGKSIALALGQKGAKVVISSRKQDALDLVAKEFIDEGIEVFPVAANIGDQQSMTGLIEQIIKQYGGVDILVNNAAANPSFGPVQQTSGEVFDKIMNVNVKGPFELAKLLYPSMKERGGGSIVNISSIGGISPEPMLGIYSVSKAAIISLTKVMGKEWGKVGIRANVICPGLIQTKFSEALWTNDDVMKMMMKELPLRRIGQADEIAGLALFLASEAGSYCTGAVFTADGGYTI